MPLERTCPECGGQIPAQAEACARCLLRGAAAQASTNTFPSEPDPLPSSSRGASSPGTANAARPKGPLHYFGDYELLEEIASGGMGVVWRARQISLNRIVAVKLLLPGLVTTEQRIRRFRTEAEAAAGLSHPHIVAIHEIGEHAGQHYFSMDFVAGEDLARRAMHARMSSRESAACLRKIAIAIHHAHQRGVLHRDLKPANVILSPDGEPHVTDFGLAKLLDEQHGPTRTGQIMGTPGFMAPELAAPHLGGATTATDVYGLGAILYHSLTGQPPFKAATLEQTLLAVTTRDPKPPRALNPSTERDLEIICLKCLGREPGQRYRSAQEVAEDVGRFLDHMPIQARPAGALDRLRLWCRRKPALALLSLGLILSLLVGATATVLQWRETIAERDRARRAEVAEKKQREAAERSASESRERLIRINVMNGLAALEDRDWFGSLFWFTEALAQEPPGGHGEDVQRYRLGALLERLPRLGRVWPHGARVNDIDISSDGLWVLSSGQDAVAKLWDARDGSLVCGLKHDSAITFGKFSQDGKQAVTVSQDGWTRAWEVPSGRLLGKPMPHPYPVTQAILSPDRKRLFTVCNRVETNGDGGLSFSSPKEEGDIRIWDITDGRLLRTLASGRSRIGQVALSADGRWLAAILGQNVSCWDLKTGSGSQFRSGKKPQRKQLPPRDLPSASLEVDTRLPEAEIAAASTQGGSGIACIALSDEGDRLLVGSLDGRAEVWPLKGGEPAGLESPPGPDPTGETPHFRWARFLPGGRSVMVIHGSGLASLPLGAGVKALPALKARSGSGRDLSDEFSSGRACLSPDGLHAFFSNQIWDIQSGDAISPSPLHWGIAKARFTPDGAGLLTVDGTTGVTRLWSLASLASVEVSHDSAPMAKLARQVLGGTNDPDSRRQITKQLMLSDVRVESAAVSADARQLFTMGANGIARVWKTETGEGLTPWIVSDWPMVSGGFSADGKQVVAAGGYWPDYERGRARIWDARSGQPITPDIEYSRRFTHSEFVCRDRWIITRTAQDAQVWDARDGSPARLPFEIQGPFRAVAASPDGQWIALCRRVASASPGNKAGPPGVPSPDGTTGWATGIWNAETGVPLIQSLQESNEVSELFFTRDSRHLMTLPERSGYLIRSPTLWSLKPGNLESTQLPSALPRREHCLGGDSKQVVVAGTLSGGGSLGAWAFDLDADRVVDTSQWRGWTLHPTGHPMGRDRIADPGPGELRLYDALSGEALSPALTFTHNVFFPPELKTYPEKALISVVSGNAAKVWAFPRTALPLEHLAVLARLLSGREVNGFGEFSPSPPTLVATWADLRAKYPDLFGIQPSLLKRWRELVVGKSEQSGNWQTAVFHLERLAAENPEDASVRSRHNLALQHLSLEQLNR